MEKQKSIRYIAHTHTHHNRRVCCFSKE